MPKYSVLETILMNTPDFENQAILFAELEKTAAAAAAKQ